MAVICNGNIFHTHAETEQQLDFVSNIMSKKSQKNLSNSPTHANVYTHRHTLVLLTSCWMTRSTRVEKDIFSLSRLS